MSLATELIRAVREGDWGAAMNVVQSGGVNSTIETASNNVFNWLIELNAPPDLVIELLRHCAATESLEIDQLGLLEACMNASSSKENALRTFVALLDFGLSPNVIADGGETLVQKAMRLNKVQEVTELLQHDVNPRQMSVFGRESSSNLQEARELNNDAALLLLRHFSER